MRFQAQEREKHTTTLQTNQSGESMQHLEEVRNILSDVLDLNERKKFLTEASPLLGAIPELDSMAVVNVITALEDHFEITVDDDEISARVFETLGSLTAFIEQKLAE
ncbi:Acyl carrier protein [Nitrosospira multiformis]|uniref:Acyl carrier protein n=2 Tax=Nitrosospira multiformis TaxID=1231 RepID=A0A1I7GCQ5_9PROT|nr:Acyl carrier protein [Nitrosospira multiformis]